MRRAFGRGARDGRVASRERPAIFAEDKGVPEAGTTAFINDGDGTSCFRVVYIQDGDGTACATYIRDSDIWSATDGSVSVGPQDDDVASFADAEVSIRLSDDERIIGQDFAALVGLSDNDAGTGTDTAHTAGKQITDSDSFTGSDTVANLHTGAFSADSGSFTESTGISASAPSDNDSGSFAEAEVSIIQTVQDSDSGSFQEASSLAVLANDSFTAQEGTPAIGLQDEDSGTLTTEIGMLPLYPRDDDRGVFTESSSSAATLADHDTGHLDDGYYHLDIPLLTAGQFEGFSIRYAAILDPVTGLPQTVLPGIRSGSVTPNTQVYSLTSDDTEIGAWTDIRYLAISIHLSQLGEDDLTALGVPVFSAYRQDGTLLDWSASLWPGAGSLNAPIPEKPLLLRSDAKDAYGRVYTLDLILYKVRLWLSVTDGPGYKTRVTVQLTGVATWSQEDEASAPLPAGPSGQSLHRMGRFVATPGNAKPITSALYGRGS